jgi:hypothetical protein
MEISCCFIGFVCGRALHFAQSRKKGIIPAWTRRLLLLDKLFEAIKRQTSETRSVH